MISDRTSSLLGHSYRMVLARFLSQANSEPTLTHVYKQMVSNNRIVYDDKQFAIVNRLAKLSALLPEAYEPVKATTDATSRPQSSGSNVAANPSSSSSSFSSSKAETSRRLRGLYIHGEVGVGKTFLMDLFFGHCGVKRKRRVHFHKFMLDVHQRIHERKKHLREKYGLDVNINLSSERDAIAYVAEDISKEVYLLCFDEFQVTDICDALMLSKFFDVLWNNGTVLVATSNRPPTDLYKEGLNRKYFIPFIRRLEKECIVREVANSRDYRQLTIRAENTYFTPNNDTTRAKLLALFHSNTYLPLRKAGELSDYAKVVDDSLLKDVVVPVMMGRSITVGLARTVTLAPKAGATQTMKVAWLLFSDLCDADRGASDYSALCRYFDALFLYGVPALSVAEHDRARRFITLVDEVYDRQRRLYWTADADPNDLFSAYDAALADNIELNNSNSGAGSANQDIRNVSTIFKNSSSTSCVYNAVTEIHTVDKKQANSISSGESLTYTNDSQEVTILVGELASVQELRFAFKRAASRLTELSGGYK